MTRESACRHGRALECFDCALDAAYSRGRDEGYDWGYRQGYENVAGRPSEESAEGAR